MPEPRSLGERMSQSWEMLQSRWGSRSPWRKGSTTRTGRGLASGWDVALRSIAGVLIVLYGVLMTAVALYIRVRGDVDPLGMLMLFAPREYLILPWIGLLLLALVSGRRRVARLVTLTVVGALCTSLFVAGYELPRLYTPSGQRRAMRIVTYNADRMSSLAFHMRDELEKWDADVVLLQGCATALAATLNDLPGVAVHTTNEYCLVTRGKLEAVDTMPRTRRGGALGYADVGNVLRYQVHVAGVSIPVYSVHFDSPRDALGDARRREFSRLAPNIYSRRLQSEAITNWVTRSDSAFVVAGDFNTPFGSAILRQDWGDLTNAFSAAGTGFGYTMEAGVYSVRIDHVLVTPTFVVQGVKVLSGYPSEHQPVIVDLAWR